MQYPKVVIGIFLERTWQLSGSGLLFIGVSRKEVLIYKECGENPAGTDKIVCALKNGLISLIYKQNKPTHFLLQIKNTFLATA